MCAIRDCDGFSPSSHLVISLASSPNLPTTQRRMHPIPSHPSRDPSPQLPLSRSRPFTLPFFNAKFRHLGSPFPLSLLPFSFPGGPLGLICLGAQQVELPHCRPVISASCARLLPYCDVCLSRNLINHILRISHGSSVFISRHMVSPYSQRRPKIRYVDVVVPPPLFATFDRFIWNRCAVVVGSV